MTTRNLHSTTSGLLVAILLSGAHCHERPKIPEVVGPDEDPRHREHRAALTSVYYELVGPPAFELPGEMRPMPLEEAAGILRRHAQRSEGAELGRRIAIVRLTLEDLELVEGREGLEPVLAYEETFLQPVGAPVDAIKAHIRQKLAERPTGRDALPLRQIVHWLKEVLRNSLFELLRNPSLEFASVACEFRNLKTFTHTNNGAAADGCGHPDESWKDGMVWVETRFEIKRPLKELARLLDPQSWDGTGLCSPYFQKACVVDSSTGGCDTCPPGAGGDWTASFFEEFSMTWDPYNQGGLQSQFLTYLDVDADFFDLTTPSHYTMEYCLDKVLDAKVGNNTTGSLETDQGFTHVSEHPDALWFQVEAHKMIEFEGWENSAGGSIDDAMNFNADVLLQALGDETLKQACCALPGDPACTSP